MARILVADDAAMLRYLACRSLDGHQTIQAEDGEEALALIKEHRPRIVILDWMMPKLSGVEVCRAIRADPDLAGIQIIVMTARTGFDSENEALEAGVDHFIAKPLMPRQLSMLVERILAGQRRRPA
ncbi:MAG: response regulator [Chloroflexi bacterium]|nr:response regulator [Chloroflexota bacterium]